MNNKVFLTLKYEMGLEVIRLYSNASISLQSPVTGSYTRYHTLPYPTIHIPCP